MSGVNELYLERRGPLQTAVDRGEVIASVAAYAGAGYLLFVEKPNDLEKIEAVDASFKAGTCPEVECGTNATDAMMRQEYFGIDSIGSVVLAGAATFAAINRMARPQRWFKKHFMTNESHL